MSSYYYTFPTIRSQIKKALKDVWDDERVALVKERKCHATVIAVVDGKLKMKEIYGCEGEIKGMIALLKHYFKTGEWDHYDYYKISGDKTNHLDGQIVKFDDEHFYERKIAYQDKLHEINPKLHLEQVPRVDGAEEPIV